MKTKQLNNGGRRSKKEKLTVRQLVRLAFRLNGICSAILYAVTSIQAFLAMILVLKGSVNASMNFPAEESWVFANYLGFGTIRESPLIQEILGNSTALHNETLYLEADGTRSFVGCQSPDYVSTVYSNTLLRSVYSAGVAAASHAYPLFESTELIIPIVNCGFPATARGDTTYARAYFLARTKTNHDDVYVLCMRYSMQDYKIVEQNEVGAIGFVTFTFFNDVRATELTRGFLGALGYPFAYPSYTPYKLIGEDKEGYWILDSVPVNPNVEAVHRIHTARRTGFYIGTVRRQSNIVTQRWSLDGDPKTAVSTWRWVGEPVLHDSLCWPHLIHGVFALESIVSLIVLFMIMWRNIRVGKIWVGDAFVSVSTVLVYRGVLIAITWIINNGWTLKEYALTTASKVSTELDMANFPDIIHADLMTLYLCVIHLVSSFLHERLDPGLAVAFFEICFQSRYRILHWFPSVTEHLANAAVADREQSIVNAGQVMDQWTIYDYSTVPPSVIAASLLPIGLSALAAITAALVQKLFRKFFFRPKVPHVATTVTTTVSQPRRRSSFLALAEKRTLTLFEIATGAPLQDRYGIAAHYENCKYIKGMKFASADGIYSNGFVITNGIYLVATADLPAIVLTKLLRYRVRAIYVYKVDGYTVQQTAQLIYPDTLSWSDLSQLNISVLS